MVVEMLEDVLIPLGLFAMVVLIVWIETVSHRRDRERRAELIRKLIDKFSTGEGFAQAMRGPGGSNLAEVLSLEKEKPKKLWVGLFIPGAILTFLGIGFFVLAAVEDEDFLVPGVVISSVGAALLLSAYVASRAEYKVREKEVENESPTSSSLGPSEGAGPDGV